MTDATFALGAGAERPSILARLSEMLRKHREFTRTRRELDGLSDRDLADLGISRYDIPAIARQAAGAA